MNKSNKKFADFMKFVRSFLIFYKDQELLDTNPLIHRSHTNFGPDRFSRFDVIEDRQLAKYKDKKNITSRDIWKYILHKMKKKEEEIKLNNFDNATFS